MPFIRKLFGVTGINIFLDVMLLFSLTCLKVQTFRSPKKLCIVAFQMRHIAM